MVGHYFSCRLARDGDENESFCQGQNVQAEGFKFLKKLCQQLATLSQPSAFKNCPF
jgi:hypothetical protein